MKPVLTSACALLVAVTLAVPAYAEDGGKRGRKGKKRKRPSVEKLFEKFDTDQNGSLTSAEVPEKAWARLSKADADGDGGVTKAEVREKRAGLAAKPDYVKQVLAAGAEKARAKAAGVLERAQAAAGLYRS